jgi:hypothetical protein
VGGVAAERLAPLRLAAGAAGIGRRLLAAALRRREEEGSGRGRGPQEKTDEG